MNIPGIRGLYDWTLKQAEKPHAAWILFAVAFAEASFFPLPPDILLLPMIIAQRQKAYRLALVCTLGSVVGGLLGYGIGALGMATIGHWIIHTYHLENGAEKLINMYNEWGIVFILIKGLTPIPFKLITIISGVAGLNLGLFVVSCAITRGARFFLVAFLVRKFGEPIRTFIEKYLNWVALGVLAMVVFGFWLVLH